MGQAIRDLYDPLLLIKTTRANEDTVQQGTKLTNVELLVGGPATDMPEKLSSA